MLFVNIDDGGVIRLVIKTEWPLVETNNQIRLPDDIKLPEDITSGNYIYNKETKQITKTGGG